MTENNFVARSVARARALRSLLCVGLDPQLELMPRTLLEEYLRGRAPNDWDAVCELLIAFNRAIIDAVCGFAVWVKPNLAFYEGYGAAGIRAYEETIAYARSRGLLVICDGKRSDGGDTAIAYARSHLGAVKTFDVSTGTFIDVVGPMRVDALTVETTIADAGVKAYIAAALEAGTSPIIVVKTSFKPDSRIEQIETRGFAKTGNGGRHNLKAWEVLATMVNDWGEGTAGADGWNAVWAVVGATYPEEARVARELMPHTWFLVPGYGAQGGGADEAVVAADKDGFGIAVNSSRGIIYAQNKGPFSGPPETYADCARRAAEHARNELNAALKRASKGAGIFWNV